MLNKINFIQDLNTYYKGEKNEAIWFTLLGIILVISSVVIWRNSIDNVLLKGLFYPIAIFGVFSTLAGGVNIYNNNLRLVKLPIEYEIQKDEFIKKEYQRFEGKRGVNNMWFPLNIMWSIITLIGIVMIFISKGDFKHGVAIGLIVIGSIGFLIDGVASYRAKIYTSQLFNHL